MGKSQNPQNMTCQGKSASISRTREYPDLQNNSKSIEKNAHMIILIWQNTPYDDQWFLKENANEGYNQMERHTNTCIDQ